MTPEQFKSYVSIMGRDYKPLPNVSGKKIGFSELAMHTKQAGKIISEVYIGPYNYAYGLTTDGDRIDGSFSNTNDGWVSFA